MKKKFLVVLSLVLILALSFSLIACNNDKNDANAGDNTNSGVTVPDTSKSEVVPEISFNVGEVLANTKVSSVTLPNEFAFVNPDEVIKNGTNKYDAKYTVGEESKNTHITLIASVKTLSPVAQIVSGVYAKGATLADVALGEGFAWANPSDSVKAGINEYDVVYSEGELSVPAKATIKAVFNDDIKNAVGRIEVAFAKDTTLESVALPEGFAWVDKTAKLSLGRKFYDAKYTKKFDENNTIDYAVKVPVMFGNSVDFETKHIEYIESMLKSDDFKKGGAKYDSVQYDQYVMILARSTVKPTIDPQIKSAYLARVEDVVLPVVDPVTNMAIKTTEGSSFGQNYTINTVMTLAMLDESTVIDGVDLAAPYYNKAIMLADTNDLYFYINSLNVMKYLNIPTTYTTKDGVKHNSDVTIEEVVDKLMSLQAVGGGYTMIDFYTNEEVFDYDGISMAMITLNSLGFKSDRMIEDLNRMGDILKNNIGANGGVITWGMENATSTATAMHALIGIYNDVTRVNNIDLNSDSMFDFMAGQIADNGAFNDSYTTKDGIIAMISYNRFLNDESLFYGVMYN